MTDRFAILNCAAEAVHDRAGTYGKPEDNARRIAALWNAYLENRTIKPVDVGIMMALLKAARLAECPHVDGFIDGAGYFAYAGEVADRAE